MSAARVDYIAPWWVVWLHSVPHFNLHLQPVDSTFSPRDKSYQEVSRAPQTQATAPCAQLLARKLPEACSLSLLSAFSRDSWPCGPSWRRLGVRGHREPRSGADAGKGRRREAGAPGCAGWGRLRPVVGSSERLPEVFHLPEFHPGTLSSLAGWPGRSLSKNDLRLPRLVRGSQRPSSEPLPAGCEVLPRPRPGPLLEGCGAGQTAWVTSPVLTGDPQPLVFLSGKESGPRSAASLTMS